MWVRRAAQRAEPGALQDFKGDPRAGLLYEVASLFIGLAMDGEDDSIIVLNFTRILCFQ
jgi:hypothetical protein